MIRQAAYRKCIEVDFIRIQLELSARSCPRPTALPALHVFGRLMILVAFDVLYPERRARQLYPSV